MSLWNWAANGPFVHPPDGATTEWYWQEKPDDSKKNLSTLPTESPTWTELGVNTGLRGDKTATNRLSYGSTI
jgi:hypothetical protein